MARQLRHRQTKAAETVAMRLPSPRHISTPPSASQLLGNNNEAWALTTVKHLDFNGDGRGDLILNLAPLSGNYRAYRVVSTAAGGYTIPNPVDPSAAAYSFFPLDWNDDGCTDMYHQDFIRVDACDGTEDHGLVIANFIGETGMDWDGDGRMDAVGSPTSSRSTGSGLVTIATDLSGSVACVPIDQDGDGLDDLVCAVAGGPLQLRLHNGANVQPDLLANVTDGYGVFANVSYQSTAQGSHTHTTSLCPGQLTVLCPAEKEYTAPIRIVSQVSLSDGIGGSYIKEYSYEGARANLQGRGFSGFQVQKIVDHRLNLVTRRQFRTDFPYTGMMVQETVYQADGTTPIHRRTVTPSVKELDNTVANQRYFPYAATIEDKQYEVGVYRYGLESITTLQTPTYDDYGNAVNVTSTVTDNDPASIYAGGQWTTTVAQTIAPSTGIYWCLGLSTQTQVTKVAPGPTGPTSITRTTTRTPDYPACRIADETIEPLSSTYAVTRGFEFDNFGNVNKVTVTGAGMAPRVTEIGWGTTGQFPVSVTNPLVQTSSTAYDDRFGLPQTQTDPNGISTGYIYDAFGRLQQETRADGTYTEWGYFDCSLAGGCPLNNSHSLAVGYYVHTANGGMFTQGSMHYDQFERLVDSEQRALGGGFDRVDVRYDNLGRVQRRSMPCAWVDVPTECSYGMTYEYDVLNRVISESRPISASVSTLQETTMVYEGRKTTITDALLHKTTRWNTVAGTLYRSEDHLGYAQIFGYDAFNSLVSVTDSLSNTLFSASYDYGIDAFQVGSNDMDLGPRGYTINALGEVRAMTDNKGSTFVMDYDALSRPTTRTVGGQTTTWTWGTGHNNGQSNEHNIEQLASTTSTGGTTERYYFDNVGRPQKQEIIADGSTYTYDYSYDSNTGALDTLTYPTSTSSYRLKLKYGYLNGVLNSVKDDATNAVFWQADEMSPRGQVTRETLGNGLKTTRVFDAVTGWVSAIKCGPNGGTCSQNQSYLYDLVGNVKQRQNNNLGLTEDFWYDEVNRLDYSKLNNQLNLDMSYDPMGNITSKSDVASGATWTYDSTRKHQLRLAGTSGVAYTYDGNGNVMTRGSQTIGWDPYNYPTLFSAAGESIALYYNANHERWKQVQTTAAVQVTTVYAGKLFEKVTIGSADEYRYYIYANGNAVSVMSRASGGGVSTRYLLSDVQGSTSKITDSSGATVVSESFSPFGERRNPATWSGQPVNGELTTGSQITQLGYTGQDALGSFGLNHMNGRVQDAVTGRFLSADPYVTEPGNTQNFNRYSYVYNNPLTFTDPSGFSCFGENSANPVADTWCSPSGGGSSGGGGDGGGGASGGGNNWINQSILYRVPCVGCVGPGAYYTYNDGTIVFSPFAATPVSAPIVGLSDFTASNPSGGGGSGGALDSTVGQTREYISNIHASLEGAFFGVVPRSVFEFADPFSPIVDSIEATSNGDYTAAVLTIGAAAFTPTRSGGKLWSATKDLSAVKNAFEHWKKHRGEFPELLNAKEYVESARRFFASPPSGTRTFTRPNGDRLFYDAASNTFGVQRADGVPRTMFRPDDGYDYWLRAIGR